MQQHPPARPRHDAVRCSAFSLRPAKPSGPWLFPRRGRWDCSYFQPLARHIAWICDNRVAFVQSREHFDAIAIIPARLNLRQVQCLVGLNHCDLRAVIPDNQRVARHHERRVDAGRREIDLRVSSLLGAGSSIRVAVRGTMRPRTRLLGSVGGSLPPSRAICVPITAYAGSKFTSGVLECVPSCVLPPHADEPRRSHPANIDAR